MPSSYKFFTVSTEWLAPNLDQKHHAIIYAHYAQGVFQLSTKYLHGLEISLRSIIVYFNQRATASFPDKV